MSYGYPILTSLENQATRSENRFYVRIVACFIFSSYQGQSGVNNKGGGGGGFKTGGEAFGAGDTTVHQAQSFTLPGSILAGTGGRGGNTSVTVLSGGFGGGGYACEYGFRKRIITFLKISYCFGQSVVTSADIYVRIPLHLH